MSNKISIKITGDDRWDRVANALNSEVGVILNTEERDNVKYYNANFPKYGAVFVGIPSTVTETELS